MQVTGCCYCGTCLATLLIEEVEFMSANRDPNAVVQFYFGNAARDLSHLLPPDEATDLEQLHLKLDELEVIANEIENAHEHISFLFRDISYFIKGK